MHAQTQNITNIMLKMLKLHDNYKL